MKLMFKQCAYDFGFIHQTKFYYAELTQNATSAAWEHFIRTLYTKFQENLNSHSGS